MNAFIANAAVSTITYVKTQDGWETTFVPSIRVVRYPPVDPTHLSDCK